MRKISSGSTRTWGMPGMKAITKPPNTGDAQFRAQQGEQGDREEQAMTRSRSRCMQRWTVAEAGMKMQPLSVMNITWFEDHW
jgi:hypothetical protein